MRIIGGELGQIWRSLIRRPGYAAVVVLTLALGIGVTTTIYSVVDAMLVRPLPYRHAERLVVIGNTVPGQEWVGARDGLQRIERIAAANFLDLSRRFSVFEQAAALDRRTWLAPDKGNGPELLQVALVTDGFFEALPVKPLLGRLPQGRDFAAPGSTGWGALISYEGWQRRFGGDPHVVGKTISIGPTFTVIGVLPPDFHQPAALVGSDAEFWLPIDPANSRYQQRMRREILGIARLKAGVTIERARAELAAAQTQLSIDEPAGNLTRDGKPLGVGVNTLRNETVGSAGRPVLILLGAAVLLLLLAGSNAANLLLVRGLEREGELAIRRALGAGRFRLGAGLVAESISLALAGGLAGLGIALAGVNAFHRFGPASLPRIAEVAVNPRIAVAGMLLSVLVGAIIGLVPAFRSSGVDLLSSLRSSLHAMTFKGTRLRTALAAIQLALALVLGIGASLLFRSFVELKTEHLGFKPEKLVAFNIPLKTERPWEAWDALLLQLQAIPGVTAAAAASNLPFQTPDWMPRVERSDQVGEAPSAGIPGYAVSPSFFATAGVPILKGRPFDGSDQPDSRGVAIVNATFARGTFGDRNAIGERIRVSGFDGPARELEIVGVAGDVVQGRVENGISPSVYVPHTQQMAGANFVIASDRDLGSLGPDIRRAVAVTPFAAMPLRDLSSMESRIEVSRAGPRFQVLLIGAFAIAALLLSAVGLYGTLAFTVRSRTKELGIRMVMGAGQASIYGLVLRQGLVVLGIGTAAGLAGAVGLTRLLQGFLYGIGPFDPVAFVAGIAVVAGAVLLAALRPAGRAARIDPMSSLRAEG